MKPCCHSKCKGKKRCLLSGRWIDYHDYGAQFDGDQLPVRGKPGKVVDEAKAVKKKSKPTVDEIVKSLKLGVPKDADLAKTSNMSNRPAPKDEGVLANMKKRLKRYMKNPPKGVNLKRIPKADKQAEHGKEPAKSHAIPVIPDNEPKHYRTTHRQGRVKDTDADDTVLKKLSHLSKTNPSAFRDTANRIHAWGKDSPARSRVKARDGVRELHRLSRDDPATFHAIRMNARLVGHQSPARARVRKQKLADIKKSKDSFIGKIKRSVNIGLVSHAPRERRPAPKKKTESKRDRSYEMVSDAIINMHNASTQVKESKGKIVRLKIDRIKMDPDNWKMAKEAGGGSATEGPVEVYRREGSKRFEMGDGHHRAVDALNRGETHIHAKILPEVLPARKNKNNK
jgi:hypothetical protein